MCNLEFTLLDFGEVDAMISSGRGGRNACLGVIRAASILAHSEARVLMKKCAYDLERALAIVAAYKDAILRTAEVQASAIAEAMRGNLKGSG